MVYRGVHVANVATVKLVLCRVYWHALAVAVEHVRESNPLHSVQTQDRAWFCRNHCAVHKLSAFQCRIGETHIKLQLSMISNENFTEKGDSQYFGFLDVVVR